MRIHACLAFAVVATLSPAFAADLPPDRAALGKQLLQDNCSRCHAIGQEGDSPFRPAPPFRNVMKIYGADSLQEALAEGLITGHPAMPEFVFPPDQVGAIITYLHSLEATP